MNPELISLLTASAQEINDMPGGIAQITSANIAGMLAKVSPEAARYARLKWAGEIHQGEEIALCMRRMVAKWKDLEKWRIPRPDFILDMCLLSLNEAVAPHRCPWCRGQESRLIEHKLVECSHCKGSGARRIWAYERADYMGVEESAWSHTWKDRYKRILAITDIWEGEILGISKN